MTNSRIEQALKIAKSHAERGQINDARNIYQSILQAAPNCTPAKIGLAALGNTGSTVKNHELPQNELKRLIQQFKQARFSGVISHAERLAKIYPKSFQLWNIYGAAAARLEQFDRAQTAFQKAVQLQPNSPDAHLNIGNVFKEKGNFEMAIKAYDNAISLQPANPQAHYNKAAALKGSTRLAEAIEAYDKVLSFSANNIDALYNKANALKEFGNLSAAVETYDKILSLKPDHVAALNNRANALQERGQADEAIASYKKIEALQPDNPNVLNNMGNALKEKGNLKEAMKAYEAALALDSQFVDVPLNIVRMPVGHLTSELLEACQRSVTETNLEQDNPAAYHFFMANLQRHKGQLDQSFQSYRLANKMTWDRIQESKSPKNNEAQIALSRISRWTPSPASKTEGGLTKLFLLGPSRSGKSTLEGLLAKSDTVYPLYEGMDSKSLSELASKVDKHVDFDTLFYVNEQDIIANGAQVVTSTLPKSIFYADALIDGLSDAFIVLVDRSMEDLSAEIFTYEYRSGHGYSYDPQSLKEYLTTYRDIGDVLLARIPNRCIRLQFADIVRSPSACIEQIAELSGVTFSRSEVPDALDAISLNSVFRTHFADMVAAS